MARTSNPWQLPKVVFGAETYLGMQRGINQLANAIRPTLGPLPRYVAHKNFSTDLPESLDSGAVIARRIIQIRDRQADVGAMYLRNLLWRLHETAGDGTATAAVLFQAIYSRGVRYIAAGGNAMRLRRHLEQGARLIDNLLARETFEIEGRHRLARLAQTICYDQELSEQLGEIFDTIGPYGRLEIRGGHSRQPTREYVEGSYWESGLVSSSMITDQTRRRAVLENASILISNLEVREPRQIIPALEAALAAEMGALLLVVRSMSEATTSLLLMPQNRERLLVAAVKTPGSNITATREYLQDLALLTGGQPLLEESGDKLEKICAAHLGRVRRAWGEAEFFGIVGGRGDPARLRQHVAGLRAAHNQSDDPRDRERLLDRLGKLLGGTATLRVGGLSPVAVDLRKELATRTAQALRGALRDGVLPGGGVALLECIPALEEHARAAAATEERAAYQILRVACQAPARTLLENAGLDPSEILPDIGRHGQGFDVVAGQLVNMRQAGILDSAAVMRAAASGAIRSAALALTIDVLVHRANPPDSSTNP